MFDFEDVKFRAEDLKFQKNSLLRMMLDAMMNGVFLLDNEKKIKYVNRFVWSKIPNGLDRLIEMDIFEASKGIDGVMLKDMFDAVDKSNKMQKNLNSAHNYRDGEKNYIDLYLYPIENSAKGRIGYVLVIEGSDVGKKYFRTDYKTNVFIKYVVDAMLEGATIIDNNGELEYANKRFYEMLGYKAGEMIGRHWMSWCYEGDLTMIDGKYSIKDKEKHGNVYIYKLRLKKKNGDLLPVMMSVTKNVDSEYNIRAIAVIVDMSEQVRLEAEYKEVSELNNRVLETISTSIITLDKDLRIKFVNNQVEVLFGKKLHEVRGKSIEKVFSDLIVFEEWSSWVLRSLKPYQVDRYKLSVGDRSIFINARIHPFYDKNNHINGVVCAFDDVSVSAKLEEQIELSFRKLEITHAKLNDLMKRQRDFLADVSHELRTPLTIMSGNVEIALANKGSSREDYKEVLNVVDGELKKMSVMVKDLTTLTNMEEGKIQISSEVFDFSEIVRDVFTRLEGMNLGTKSVHILMDEEFVVFADKEKLGALVWNLVENGLKYSGSDAEVLITVDKEENVMLLKVKDNGVGIPKNDMEYIFDRFYRVDKARSTEKGGSGLGLAIVKWIVEAHKGEISVDSEVDKGTVFEIKLPIIE